MSQENNKKNPFLWLWILLVIALIAIGIDVIPSLLSDYSPKSSGIAKVLFPDKESADSVVTEPADDLLAEDIDPQPAPQEPDTAAHTILFIGDSMLDGLSPRLAAYAAQNGHKLYSVVWYSSSTEIWGKSHRLADYIKQVNPSYIFICLGSNELYVNDIIEKRTPYIKEVLAQIDTIPYLWIGPPNWVKDTGINKMIADNTAPGCYFKSDGMKFERRKDGAHPTAASAIEWMDSIVRWMPDHANHPIKMNMPEQRTARPERIFIHQPGDK